MTKSKLSQEALDLRHALVALRDLIDDALASSREVELEEVDNQDDAASNEQEAAV
jgi:hypothetical protein